MKDRFEYVIPDNLEWIESLSTKSWNSTLFYLGK